MTQAHSSDHMVVGENQAARRPLAWHLPADMTQTYESNKISNFFFPCFGSELFVSALAVYDEAQYQLLC